MSFTSLAFVAFAAAVLLLYYLVPKRGQWVVLLVASLAFYAIAGAWYLPFILVTIATTFLAARLMASHVQKEKTYIEQHREEMTKEDRKQYKNQQKKKRFGMLVVTLVLNFGILAVLKYTGFAFDTINDVVSLFNGGADVLTVPSLLLPLGISFYTFRSIGYLIDVYRGTAEAQGNPFKYALFVSFFPALVQGPISRYKDLAPQLFAPHRPEWHNLSTGLIRVLWGFFKKVVVADTAMIGVKAIVTNHAELNGMYALCLIVLYSAVIYGDFTGGIDVTIGFSKMCGLTLAENFNRPFSSHSTQEYWNRWHITMGTWFTDYVFYPLSVCRPMQRFTKWSKTHLGRAVGMRMPVYLATLVTWYLTGLWHGASWNFIVWGLLNGVVILVSREFAPLYEKFHQRFPKLNDGNKWYGGFCAVRTFFLMGAIRSLDCYRDVPVTFGAFGSIFYRFGTWQDLFTGQVLTRLGMNLPQVVLILLGTLLIFFVSRAGKEGSVADRLSERPWMWSACCAALVILIAIFGSYGFGFDAGDFIYGQV